METKREIRKKIFQKRQELKLSVWLTLCKSITDAVISHPWFLKERNIYTYVDYNREVRTRELIDAAFRMGKNVWVPKVMGESMHFYRIEGMDELRPGIHGIMEPVRTRRMDKDGLHVFDLNQEEDRGLMIMPGVAFDEKCGRIGYGKGYYDRYLADHPGFRRIALAFEFQVFCEVPHEEHDIRPELLITEKRIVSYFGTVS